MKNEKVSKSNIEKEIYDAMVHRGWVFPLTLEGVEMNEMELSDEQIANVSDLPHADILIRKIPSERRREAPAILPEEESFPRGLLAMLRKRSGLKATFIAESLGVTVPFLSDLGSYPQLIPCRVREEIARRVELHLPGISHEMVMDSFDRSAHMEVAAYRDRPFIMEEVDFEKIVRRSDMSEEQKRYWLELAE
jgi:hypothetical protein